MISREFTGFNGLTLKSDCFGDPGSKQCILLAHGGGQTRRAWQSTAKQVAAQSHYAVALDLRGHGDSDWAPDGDYSIDAFANDLLLVSVQLSSRPILIGASLGGIAAMIAAGEIDQTAFSAVIFVDITPTMEPAGVEKVATAGTGIQHLFRAPCVHLPVAIQADYVKPSKRSRYDNC